MKSTMSLNVVVAIALVSQGAFAIDVPSVIRSQSNVTNGIIGGSLATTGALGSYGSYRLIKKFGVIDSPELQRTNFELQQLYSQREKTFPLLEEKQRALKAIEKIHSAENVQNAIQRTRQIQNAITTLTNAQSIAILQSTGVNLSELSPFMDQLQAKLETSLNDHTVSAQQKQELIAQARLELQQASQASDAAAQELERNIAKEELLRTKVWREAAQASRKARLISLTNGSILAVLSTVALASSAYVGFTVMLDGATPRPATAEETALIIENAITEAQTQPPQLKAGQAQPQTQVSLPVPETED